MLPIRLPNTILASRRQQPLTPSPTEPKVQVRPLTKDSLETRQHVSTSLGYGYQTRNKVSVLDGSVLPSKFEPFPSELYGMPLEEIDNFIFDETFCVVSKRFRKNYIHRFTATKSFFMFSPWNSFRQLCIYISTNQIFDYVVMTTILLNCVFLAKTDSVEEAEYIFLAIYTAEMVIKTISKGFILNKYTYLRNPWNWLDFIVITSGYATIGMDVGNLAGLRTFRVLRALKTVSIMPGLKTIINALLHSFRQLAEVMTLTIFCLMVFALFALQVYMGELRNKCVMVSEENVNWLIWINKEQNWLLDASGNPLLCGNVTGARHCPVGYVCLGVGPNPNHGYTNFDNFLWSMLTTFQLITLDYWENVYNIVLATCGPMSVVFFTVVVFFGSFYLINLMLAVVALSYEEEAEITQEERRKDLTDYRDESTFSFDPSRIPVKQLGKENKVKKLDGRKGVLLSSVTRKRKKSRRRRPASQQRSQRDEQHQPEPEDGQQLQRNEDNEEDYNETAAIKKEPEAVVTANAFTVSNCGPATSVDDYGDDDSDSPCRKRKASSSPDPPAAAPSPQPATPPPQPEPPPIVSDPATRSATATAADTLRPCALVAPQGRERWLLGSIQGGSANTSEGNNRDSSLDDSGVVDDHDDGEATSQSQSHQTSPQPQQCGYHQLPQNPTNDNGGVVAVSKSIKVIKCNGLKTKPFGRNGEAEYVSQVVVIDDLVDRNCSNCNRNCINYQTWLRVQNCLHKVVRDPLFELFIMACIICNTIVLAIEHHGMSQNVRNVLDVGNKVFTTIFTVECLFKLIALSNEFFNCGWNIFDMIIVTASLLDLSFEMIDGLSVLRCLRLLRVLKLAQSWTTMKVLLSIIISTIGALGNLTFVLIIIIYIFAVIGMQLFSKEYMPEKFDPDPVPRWNFSDFFHSFMMIFRILCGEWIEPLWDCMKAEEKEGFGICFAIFLPALVMGNFMVLNLFLALLLNSFNSEELKSKKEEVGDSSKLERSFERIRSIIRKRKRRQSRTETTTSSCDTTINFKLENTVKQLMRFKNEKKKLKTETSVNVSNDETCERQQSVCEYDVEIGDQRNNIITTDTDQNDGTSLVLNVGYLDQQENGNADYRIQRAATEDSSDTGYNQPFTTQLQTSVVDGGSHVLTSSEDLLYHQIMQDAMCYAPTLTRDLDLPMLDETFELSEHHRHNGDNDEDSPPPIGIHRRSYILATRQDSSKDEIDEQDETCFLKQPKNNDVKVEEISKKKPWITLVSYVDELTVGGRRDSKGNFIDSAPSFPGFGRNKQSKAPQECFPFSCYQKIGIKQEWLDTCFGDRWMSFRRKTLVVVDTPIFEWFILVLIFASSVTLCFEDIYLDENKTLKDILYWTNFTFCVIFTIELMLKWIALGIHKYFKSFWTALDFIIAMMSIFSLLIDENENLKVLRSLRTLRALRPLRAISRWQGMRIVVNALMYAIPSIFNVLLVCLVFWLIFSIMGVQFFGGKFFKCVDDNGDRVSVNIVNNRSDCMLHNYTWLNSKISFDNVGIAYLALFQVATFEGWMEVMADAVDARGVDLQPEYEANLYAYIYFVIFIVCGAFFTLNLFIGVIIDNFNMLKKKYEGGVLEMFLTESQKHYYTAMKKLGRKKPQKVIKRPVNQFMAIFYDLSNSRRFEIAIFVLIFLNMLTMGIEHYNQPVSVFFILEVCNAFFTTVFGLEALVKIIGLRFHYFVVPWNVFDFLLVLASVLGILMEDIMIDFPVSPTLLRVVRVFRIGRILRLIKAAKGIRKLLFALIVSLPALFNIGALLGLITFIYAIIGMSVFGHVKKQKAINDMVNFETFGRSMQLLFRLMTSAGWNDVLESLMVQPPDCDPESPGLPNGNCGHPILAITYFTSFIIISYMIVINMYIAIILENFNQAHQEEEIGIVEDDLEMFYIRWSKYDPHATQFIAFNQISDFIASLDPPLGIPKPNIVALVSFNLPIARGNKIHCLDILHALVKHVLGHVEETDEFKKLQDQMDVKFKKQFPTRKELEIVSSTRLWKRQDKAARLIQRTYRNFRRRKKDINDLCSDTQSSSPGGWQSRLSSFLHVKGMSISGIGGGVGSNSRASSRKSSRASDASDISELGASLWLNLPLFFLSGAQIDMANKNEEQSPKKKSIVDEGGPVHITISEPSPEAKPNAMLPLSLQDEGTGDADRNRKQLASNVSITITDASPDGASGPKPLPAAGAPVMTAAAGTTTTAHTKRLAFRRASEAKIVQHKALVHRTSEGPHYS
ncbi:Voltage gated sodium channel, alpha subunit,Voltage-dependent L-type calcium channel, IQ- [Cinara cedri]|uniref:Sodium channel protein n=1 Tax=Cinara cedri TaxID=506608 RepID=A0A5E4NGH8_9HEMI|nr:Voltage gated sodium channel, alpha subunit,Voltage-dependent L-type calcium channel, IQ- [Cinara cedri]